MIVFPARWAGLLDDGPLGLQEVSVESTRAIQGVRKRSLAFVRRPCHNPLVNPDVQSDVWATHQSPLLVTRDGEHDEKIETETDEFLHGALANRFDEHLEQDFVDEEEEGCFEFGKNDQGEFHFGYVHGHWIANSPRETTSLRSNGVGTATTKWTGPKGAAGQSSRGMNSTG